jgi:hypothetical protein
LRGGTFGDKVDMSKKWMDRNHLTIEDLNTKWTEEEIMDGLKRLSLLHIEGYYPQDKSTLSKSLAGLIYNPGKYGNGKLNGGGTSWFLKVMLYKPRKLREAEPSENTSRRTRRKAKANRNMVITMDMLRKDNPDVSREELKQLYEAVN